MVIDLPVGLPLGLGSASFEAATVKLSAGATIALYTDGLVESRSRSLGEVCETITRELQLDSEDDVTLVLARVPAARSGTSSFPGGSPATPGRDGR